MEVQILRDGEEFGPFSLDDVRRHLAEGSLLCSDLARHEKLFSWVPINQLLYEPLPPAPPELSPPSEWSALFSETIDWKSHLNFVESLLGNNLFDKGVSAGFSKQINLVRTKANDFTLYVAVIGEFSTGKSTFINALTKRDLLSSDVLQGTTVSATYITFGPHLEDSIQVVLSSDEIENPSRNSSETFSELIHRVTAVEENGQRTKRVNLSIRSPSTLSDIVLIDTPGLNADNSRHAEVTASVVTTSADVAIIITAAVAPLSMVLTRFLRENLGETLARCLVVLTKYDLLDASDGVSVLANVKKRYLNEFQHKSALVLPLSPLALLARLKPKAFSGVCDRLGEDTINHFTNDFFKKENELSEFFQKYRWAILAERLIRHLEKLLVPLLEEILKIRNHASFQCKQLETEKVFSLDEITNERIAWIRSQLTRFRTEAQKKNEEWLSYNEGVLKNNVLTHLNAANDLASLQQIRHSSCLELLRTFSGEVHGRIAGEAQAAAEQAKRLHNQLFQDFRQSFPYLEPLKMRLTRFQISAIQIDQGQFNRNVSPLDAHYTKTDQAASNAKFGAGAKGAVIGGAIGSIIPVVGTLLGAAIGGTIAASLEQPSPSSTSHAREPYKTHLIRAISTEFAGLKTKSNAELGRLYDSMTEEFGSLLTEYCNANRWTVNGKISDVNSRKEKWQRQFSWSNECEKEIRKRLDSLKHAKSQIPAFEG